MGVPIGRLRGALSRPKRMPGANLKRRNVSTLRTRPARLRALRCRRDGCRLRTREAGCGVTWSCWRAE